jgi:hypothetical protein
VYEATSVNSKRPVLLLSLLFELCFSHHHRTPVRMEWFAGSILIFLFALCRPFFFFLLVLYSCVYHWFVVSFNLVSYGCVVQHQRKSNKHIWKAKSLFSFAGRHACTSSPNYRSFPSSSMRSSLVSAKWRYALYATHNG